MSEENDKYIEISMNLTSKVTKELEDNEITKDEFVEECGPDIVALQSKLYEIGDAEMCKCIKNFLAKFKKDDDILSNRPAIKKAVLVGINKYDPALGSDLRGCVNDVENMYKILTEQFGFAPDNVRVVTDLRATKEGILERLEWLVKDMAAGDELFFHYSGHGSQVRDRNGDELEDGMDEILCPTNLDWNDPLIDDDLAIIFKKVPQGVFLTMFCDACHSGSMTRGLNPGNPNKKDHLSKPRYLEPPFDVKTRGIGRKIPVNIIGAKKDKSTPQNHVLISGCRDDQTSSDAHIGGKYQGAFTWAITEVINDNPNITFKEAHAKVLAKLKTGYTQIPVLSGSDSLITRPLFGGK